MRRRVVFAAALILLYVASGPYVGSGSYVASGFSQTNTADARPAKAGRYGLPDSLPSRLTSQEFWALMTSTSEPDGNFRSDNLVSNELKFQWVIPDLVRRVKPGGVYIGVGPEQNFSYVAALRPKVAFIVDVRRGNADLHLMYKALFELSADRADFVSRLLSRPRPAGLTAKSTAADIFAAFSMVDPSERMLNENLASIRHQLTTEHRFPLTGDDLMRIEAISRVFFLAGTKIQYSPYGSFGGTTQPTYAELMAATDEAGEARSFLANDANYGVIKDLERRNMLIPVVGDFAGPKTLRAIGAYARRRGSVIAAFYVSNVEEYLQGPAGQAFCGNVSSLPMSDESVFIRAVRGDTLNTSVEGFVNQLSPMPADVRRCQAAG